MQIISKKYSDLLENQVYVDSRLKPTFDDNQYLHLSDLRLALDKVVSSEQIRILDYGCGGSPYRSLFPNASYHRADFTEVADLDFKIGEDSLLRDVPAETYDKVLSTQVLEHVLHPQNYLCEAWRVLRPGGELILTTHGSFRDHGCPYDFYRWTADGLQIELKRAGFDTKSIYKLTTNTRAVFFLGEHYLSGVYDSRLSKAGFAWWVFRELFWKHRIQRNRWADHHLAGNRVVDANQDGHEIYIALISVSEKVV
jgi:SAM-dependent methyltransferase